MRVLAIGGTGFIGAQVVRRLLDVGHEVTVLHRRHACGGVPTHLQRMLGDRDALPEMRAEIERCSPDVVLDVIPYTERQAAELVCTLRGLCGRLVVVSSTDVYRNYDGLRGVTSAPPDPVPLAEDAPLRETLYSYRGRDILYRDEYDKILVERVVLDQPDLEATVLCLPAVYGAGDPQRRLRPYLRRMADGRPAILLAHGQANWRWGRGYVGNVAAALALAVTDARAAGRVYNVGEEPSSTELEWIHRIGAAAGWKGNVVTVPTERLPTRLREPFDWRYDLVTDTRRIRWELGYEEPIPPHEALERTVDWECSQPDYGAEDAALAWSREAGIG